MLEITGGEYRGCDGVSRRRFLRAGVLGLTGLSLADMLRLRAARADDGPAGARHLGHPDLEGGRTEPPRHVGPQARRARRVPRRVQADRDQRPRHRGRRAPAALGQADGQVRHRPLGDPPRLGPRVGQPLPADRLPPDQRHPCAGDAQLRLDHRARCAGRGGRACRPTSRCPPPPRSASAGYLGVAYNPFSVGSDPNQDNFSVRNLTLPGGISLDRLQNRRGLLESIDTLRRDSDQSGLMDGLDAFTRKAFEMVTSPAAQRAFDIGKEETATRDLYGRTKLGQSLLLARRLVEAGVTFVTVDAGGWDTHANNFESLKTKKLPEFDRAWAGLMQDMAQRGLMQDTLVLVWGEFGRTPRINKDAGRDHWPGAQSVVLAGGGMKMGQAIGSTDAQAELPRERPLTPEDVLATMYAHLGIDGEHEFLNEAQRPLKILNGGTPIRELVG